MVSPGALDRWISLEVGRVNAGLVVEKRSLAGLRRDTHPSCRTREGDEVVLERGALDRLASALTPDEAGSLRVPITLFASGDFEDVVVLTDALAAKALRAVEKFGAAFPFRDGRMLLPQSLAVDVVRRSGGTIQIAYA